VPRLHGFLDSNSYTGCTYITFTRLCGFTYALSRFAPAFAARAYRLRFFSRVQVPRLRAHFTGYVRLRTRHFTTYAYVTFSRVWLHCSLAVTVRLRTFPVAFYAFAFTVRSTTSVVHVPTLRLRVRGSRFTRTTSPRLHTVLCCAGYLVLQHTHLLPRIHTVPRHGCHHVCHSAVLHARSYSRLPCTTRYAGCFRMPLRYGFYLVAGLFHAACRFGFTYGLPSMHLVRIAFTRLPTVATFALLHAFRFTVRLSFLCLTRLRSFAVGWFLTTAVRLGQFGLRFTVTSRRSPYMLRLVRLSWFARSPFSFRAHLARGFTHACVRLVPHVGSVRFCCTRLVTTLHTFTFTRLHTRLHGYWVLHIYAQFIYALRHLPHTLHTHTFARVHGLRFHVHVHTFAFTVSFGSHVAFGYIRYLQRCHISGSGSFYAAFTPHLFSRVCTLVWFLVPHFIYATFTGLLADHVAAALVATAFHTFVFKTVSFRTRSLRRPHAFSFFYFWLPFCLTRSLLCTGFSRFATPRVPLARASTHATSAFYSFRSLLPQFTRARISSHTRLRMLDASFCSTAHLFCTVCLHIFLRHTLRFRFDGRFTVRLPWFWFPGYGSGLPLAFHSLSFSRLYTFFGWFRFTRFLVQHLFCRVWFGSSLRGSRFHFIFSLPSALVLPPRNASCTVRTRIVAFTRTVAFWLPLHYHFGFRLGCTHTVLRAWFAHALFCAHALLLWFSY